MRLYEMSGGKRKGQEESNWVGERIGQDRGEEQLLDGQKGKLWCEWVLYLV